MLHAGHLRGPSDHETIDDMLGHGRCGRVVPRYTMNTIDNNGLRL